MNLEGEIILDEKVYRENEKGGLMRISLD